MLTNFRSAGPSTLKGPLLLDAAGMPRFWATVWSSFLRGGLAPSTVRKQLAAVERFYVFTDDLYGKGALDDAISALDITAIGEAQEAYFLSMRNRPGLGASSEASWQTMLRFCRETLNRIVRSVPSISLQNDLQDRLVNLDRLQAKLHAGGRRRPERIRSLPADAVAALYDILDPESPNNPFRTERSRWQVYVIFILLLHQGLRRGELLCLTADAIKSGFDRKTGRERFWLTVRLNPNEVDPRSSTPSIKTADSYRQLPMSERTARLVEHYSTNYRGRQDHSFLISSQKGLPMSTERVSDIFAQISSALPPSALTVLEDRYGDPAISPHDLRHTCAALRLNQLLGAGVNLEEATQQLRSFFGWSRSSDMPLRYARTVFDDRLAGIWRTEFDERVEVLRHLGRT